ncbi:MAG: hypothetical protein ACK5WS_02060 [Alphaproteobacteria bacterium]|jgi:LPS-assembly lipoprotein|nr:hypothetical protein [Candidatus Jidaibacter sp.]
MIKLITFLLLSVSLLSGCGFKPIYEHKKHSSMPVEIGNLLFSDMKFKKHIYTLKSSLTDTINPDKISPKYYLNVTIHKTKYSFDTQNNSINNRIKILIVADYQLFDIETKKQITKDTIYYSDSFEVSSSPYSAHISEEETVDLLLSQLADEIKIRITDYM